MQNCHFFRVEPKLKCITCKKDGRKLQEDWLKDPSFREWVKKVSDSRQYRCTVCHKTLSSSTVGRASLTEHANGMTLKDNLDKRQNLF